MTQLQQLAKPFPKSMVHSNPSGGGSYVKHSAVVQKVLAVCGPYRWSIVDVVRGYVQGTAPNPSGSSKRAKDGTPDLHDAVVGCIGALTVEVDGRLVTVHGAGDCEQPHNWPHDGARLKDAESDAFKRAAMKLGVGLHLWAQDEYALDKQLAAKGGESVGSAPSQTSVKDTEHDPADANSHG